MPDFNKGSTFNKDANFQGVKFGADAPLLETELNELQDIQTEARAEIIRDTIPSGFVKLGELDYDYMLNNENCVKLKTDSVAYVNGYKILIPKDTIVDIGKAPEKDAREDLLFLEVWKEEVTKDSILTVAGGEGQAQISNTILDDRVGQETARRIALKWRIRHVANADFNSEKLEDGLAYKSGTANEELFRKLTYPQAGNSEPLLYDSPHFPNDNIRFTMMFRQATLSRYDWQLSTGSNDTGLFIGGDGKDNSKKVLNTLDGYVYAIPMFRLYRKPSCGKAIPFEYQKINPKVDYSKFAELMKEEKVERVVTETIQGQSLVNIVKGTGISNNFHANATISDLVFDDSCNGISATVSTVTSTPNYSMLGLTVVEFSSLISLSKTYTILFKSYGDIHPNRVAYMNGDSTKVVFTKYVTRKYGFNAVLINDLSEFETNLKTRRLYFIYEPTEIKVGAKLNIKDIMILEGDWTNKELPDFFTGLKSLGEDEGNLITVKNAILNESSYDPDTGTPKLNTVSGANYITSDNLIMPNIEAQVKRGETKLSDLTSFDKVDNLVGDEKVDFTKIKGRTLQNLITNKAWTVNSSGANAYMSMNWELLKPNTNYTYFVINPSPKMNLTKGYVGNRFVTYSSLDISKPVLLTTIPDFSVVTGTSYPHVYPIDDSLLTQDDLANVKLLLLEGDWTNVPLDQLPFIEGIKSVGENEDNKVVVKRTGKNLFDINMKPNRYAYTKTTIIENGIKVTSASDGQARYVQYCCKLKPNTTYNFRWDGKIIKGESIVAFYHSINETRDKYIKADKTGSAQFTTSNTGEVMILFYCVGSLNGSGDVEYTSIQLEEGTISTLFIPHNEYKQEITLKEPLRSLPNGVCDEIVGNKVIRRVGKIVLDGSENWSKNAEVDETNTIRFIITPYNLKASAPSYLTSNFLARITMSHGDYEYIYMGGKYLYLNILRSRLSTQDVTGLKTWLSQNPTTVYYELATPIEEPIEPNYDKESIKTYQLDQPLRSLPNGVKDEIVGNKLIRRCGEVILNGGENWYNSTTGVTTSNYKVFYTTKLRDIKKDGANNLLLCDKFQSTIKAYMNMANDEMEGISNNTSSGLMYFSIAINKLSSTDVEGFKTWVKANPIKVVYELATPIEVPLKEVLPSKSNFSLERQFKYSDNYLLELPNGAKDTVENGKVTRRVKKVVLNGSESWADSSSLVLTNTLAFRVIPSDKKVDTEIFCDKFKYVYHNSLTTLDEEFITGQGTTSQVYVRIAKSKLSSPDLVGFKAWLSDNPITIMYELTTPTTEELSGNNNRYCPYHKEDNTYCGSMYVGDGTNDVLVENGLKSDSIIIDTPFRSITNKEVVNDCKYKKSVDGYDNMYITSNGNLLDDSVYKGFKLKEAKIHFQPVRLTPGKYSLRIVFTDGTVVPNSNVCIFIFDEKKLPIMGLATNGVLYVDWEVAKKGKYLVLARNDMGISAYGEKVIQNIIVSKSETFVTDISDYSPTEKAFENIESNDVEDLRHITSLTGFNFEQILNESFDALLRGQL